MFNDVIIFTKSDYTADNIEKFFNSAGITSDWCIICNLICYIIKKEKNKQLSMISFINSIKRYKLYYCFLPDSNLTIEQHAKIFLFGNFK